MAKQFTNHDRDGENENAPCLGLSRYSDEKISEKKKEFHFSEASSPMPYHRALPLPHLCRKDDASSSGVALLKFALHIFFITGMVNSWG